MTLKKPLIGCYCFCFAQFLFGQRKRYLARRGPLGPPLQSDLESQTFHLLGGMPVNRMKHSSLMIINDHQSRFLLAGTVVFCIRKGSLATREKKLCENLILVPPHMANR